MSEAVIRLPDRVAEGQVFQVRVLLRHPMESGYRHDAVGRLVARHIVQWVRCLYGGGEVFRAELSPGISANPFFQFPVQASASGELRVEWSDDRGRAFAASARVVVG